MFFGGHKVAKISYSYIYIYSHIYTMVIALYITMEDKSGWRTMRANGRVGRTSQVAHRRVERTGRAGVERTSRVEETALLFGLTQGPY